MNRILFLILISLTLFSCQKEKAPEPVFPEIPESKTQIIIDIQAFFKDQPFSLNQQFVTSLNDTVSIQILKYYLSNFALIDINGKEHEINESYFLIDHAKISNSIALNISQPTTFTALKFIIGVDSLRNVSGAQKGALDPINGMFWTWNSGYVFLFTEGNYQKGEFLFHIGGFKQPYNSIQQVFIDFKGNELTIAQNQTKRMELIFDADELFKSFNIEENEIITDIGSNATSFSNSYKQMLKFGKLK
jgi:hypothetical protein